MRHKAEQLERNVNFHNAGNVRSQIESDHREKGGRPALIKTINRQLDAIDLMAPFAQEVWPKTATCQTIDDICQQRDAASSRQRGGD